MFLKFTAVIFNFAHIFIPIECGKGKLQKTMIEWWSRLKGPNGLILLLCSNETVELCYSFAWYSSKRKSVTEISKM